MVHAIHLSCTEVQNKSGQFMSSGWNTFLISTLLFRLSAISPPALVPTLCPDLLYLLQCITLLLTQLFLTLLLTLPMHKSLLPPLLLHLLLLLMLLSQLHHLRICKTWVRIGLRVGFGIRDL
ncbi:hypothetical protein F5879DRAFT_946807 [Lentinula edodes]|nr:hypothetical protein F5879DRAFT_946807 [Lentinula edodes]